MAACHLAEGGGCIATTVLKTKLTVIKHNLLRTDKPSLEVASFHRTPQFRTVISDRMYQCNYCLCGGRLFLMVPTLLLSQISEYYRIFRPVYRNDLCSEPSFFSSYLLGS